MTDIPTVGSPDVVARVALGHQLADEARAILNRYFRRSELVVATKQDVSPIVTEADTGVESALRDLIHQHFPKDGIIGEELGTYPSTTGYSWVIDPIDGTSSFVRGLPVFGMLLACVFEAPQGELVPIFGMLDQPFLKERFVGIRGQGSSLNGNVIQAGYGGSDLRLRDVCLSSTTPLMFVSEYERRGISALEVLTTKRAFGGDCYSYAMLAAGYTSMPLLIVEAQMKFFDFCALIPILEGAGAVITDWQGRPLHQDSSQVIAAPSKTLLDAALKILEPLQP